jgi:hypothetical protein
MLTFEFQSMIISKCLRGLNRDEGESLVIDFKI